MLYNTYVNYIKMFVNSDINSWQFKSHPDYRYMLEHVSAEQGYKYLSEITHKFNLIYNANKDYFIELCHKNDLCGKPEMHNFTNFSLCSPSNLRYILHSLLILSYMKKCMLNNIDVVEIGGGYGGLCFFIYKLAHLFDISINTYSIFDLQAPLMVQKKYLENLNIINLNYVELDDFKNIKENSFLISNYAFSEISLDLQKRYTTSVLNPYISHGFLAWNNIDVYNFIDNKNIAIENEIPLTGPKNKYVSFKPNTD